MAKKKGNTESQAELFIEQSGQIRLLNKSAEQQALESRPVECLGMTFENDQKRREYFTEKLREKLKDTEFRKTEGFPIGSDNDILALSDPPYYTVCPNPFLGEFLQHYCRPYKSKELYHREPFAADVSEGKNHPIYNAHAYHTKVPHRAIMRYLLHFTQPGDFVLDSFSGTGMTGVACRLCGDRKEVEALGYRVQDDGSILNEEGNTFSMVGERVPILNDLSPAGTFIAHNYNSSPNTDLFVDQANKLLEEVEEAVGWMYECQHDDSGAKGRINFTVWSDVFLCPNCQAEIVFMDVALDDDGEVSVDTFECSQCSKSLTKATATKRMEQTFSLNGELVNRIKKVPVIVDYTFGNKRFRKPVDEKDRDRIDRISSTALPSVAPLNQLNKRSEQYKRDALHLRGICCVADFYTRRNLIVLAEIWERVLRLSNNRNFSLFWMTSIHWLASNMYRYRDGGGGGQQGKLTIPSLIKEQNVLRLARDKLSDVARMARHFRPRASNYLLATGDASAFGELQPNTIDYAFIDPPFGGNIFYSDLNVIWEGWLGVSTASHRDAVIHRVQTDAARDIEGYASLMLAAFKSAFALLKPGRWITVEFSNSQAAVWNVIQNSLQEAGFVVASVAALDKKQRSFRSVTSSTAPKQDLVISAYKPNGGLEERFVKHGTSEEGVWDFLRTHLNNLPIVKPRGGELEFIAERDPRILYDRMVAFYVGHSRDVPLSSAEFQEGLGRKFPERDGMFFLPAQVSEYDKKRAQMERVGQMTIFVEDERSAIDWLRNFLKDRPSAYQDIQPEFMRQLSASWKKWELRPELNSLLDQNFLSYDGQGEVPSQIHSYLSTQFKDMRNLPKDAAELRSKAKSRWYVPDPKKNIDIETLRNKHLLEEFWAYLPDGYRRPLPNTGQATLPLPELRPKAPLSKRLKELRTEAIRVGFKHCWQNRDYATIIAVAERIPESVLQEDPKLLMWYDQARTRTEGV